jgi:hypothetical protein
MSMANRDYSHRDVVDKLGIKPGHVVAFDEEAWPIDEDLRRRVAERTGQAGAPPKTWAPSQGEAVDIALVTTNDSTDAVMALRRWKSRLDRAGRIWLLTRKRGQPGYVDQRELIAAGAAAGLIDNKSCSVSDTVSALRFVIRKEDRGKPG